MKIKLSVSVNFSIKVNDQYFFQKYIWTPLMTFWRIRPGENQLLVTLFDLITFNTIGNILLSVSCKP